jgi:TRAP-type mannitol/chloroaromatic compound transport system substrate-binding protein
MRATPRGFYYIGKAPALMFDTGVPFGLTPRQHISWMRYGGGLELMREMYAPFGVLNSRGQYGRSDGRLVPQGDQDDRGPQRPAHARSGVLGTVFGKLGVVVQQIPRAISIPRWSGRARRVEWVGPYDDEKLGFNKVANFYYGPGVMELGASIAAIVGTAKWNELPQAYKEAFEAACAEANQDMLAKYDAYNMQALRRLLSAGVQLRFWSPEIMKALQTATNEAFAETAARDANFKRVHAAWKTFKDEQVLWNSVNDGAAAQFLNTNRG